ncbi:hypothetical protein N658DRAFT_432179 [Parathielavia hyrcaniae]|uniref:BTB domain-containing protein n=1 Tax=Parathielavia hyrcaniae TaxID=113614 RepID=A0AAN6PXI3_9PEZI|nr:hypothetical protein N658DRAFT_432179 [Parathielavia hyrcaniae]
MHSIGSSKPFRFTVGPEKREFTIHEDLVARQSPALESLVNGSFSEAQKGHAVLESVDEHTFAFFIEYVYTGHYGDVDQYTPRPVYYTDEESGLESEELDYESGWEGNSDNARPSEKRLWFRFVRRSREFWKRRAYAAREDEVEHQQAEGAVAAKAANKPGIEVFLRHARLQVFADYYGIIGLMDLTFEHMGQLFIGFEPKVKDTGVILELLRFCYDTPAPDALKSFIVLYAACKAEVLWMNKGFQKLVDKNREFSLAFLGQIMGTKG